MNDAFHGYPHSDYINTGVVPEIRTRLLPFTSLTVLTIYYSLIVLVQGGSDMTGTDFFLKTIIAKHLLAHVSLQHTPLRSQHFFSNVLEAS
jgi:hypothetical protein